MKSYKTNATREIQVTEEDVSDILCSALEGGIGYWACLDNSGKEFDLPENGDKSVSETASEILVNGGDITFFDEFDGDTAHKFSLDSLLEGIRKFWENGYDVYHAIQDNGTIDCCEIDAESADCVVQLGIFGEVVYG